MSLPARSARALAVAAAALACSLPAAASAQTPSFPAAGGYAADGPVYAVEHEPAGPTFIGGDFDHLGLSSGRGLALSAADATIDSDWPSLSSPGFPGVAGGDVLAVVSDEFGGWFIGGDFKTVGGIPHDGLAHLTADGLVSTWRADIECRTTADCADGAVRALAYSTTGPDAGTLYVGGNFDFVGGIFRTNLAAVNGVTGVVRDWRPEPGPKGANWIYSLAHVQVPIQVQDAPTAEVPIIFVGGEFNVIGADANPQPPRNRIAAVWGVGALTLDGQTSISGKDTGWNPNAGTNAATVVRAVSLGPWVASGEDSFMPVYFGGNLPNISGARGNLAAAQLKVTSAGVVTSALYPTTWRPLPNGPVNSLAMADNLATETLRDGGTLYAAGEFLAMGATSRRYLGAVATIPLDAIPTSSCSPTPCPSTVLGWAPDADAPVNTVAIAGDVVHAAGEFDQIGAPGTSREHSRVASLSAAGAPDEGQAAPWDPLLAGGDALALASDDDSVYVGGSFNMVGAQERKNLAVLDADGVLDPAWAPEVNGRIEALAKYGDTLYAGGGFTTVDASPRAHLAAFDLTTGDLDGTWDPGVDSPCTSSPGNPCTLQGFGSCLPVSPSDTCNAPTSVFALEATDVGVYAGGSFTRAVGVGRPGAAAFAPVGAEDELGESVAGDPLEFRPATDGQVRALAVTCETVYAGGNFTHVGDPPAPESAKPERRRIAALDADTGQPTAWNPDADGTVFSLALEDDILYAGGNFAFVAGKIRHRVAALPVAGGLATSWNPTADQTVRALAISGGGDVVYAGGTFDEIGGATRSRLAALNANGVGSGLGTATAFDPVADGSVRALSASGENLYAGGDFVETARATQSGFGLFLAGEEEASEPLVCAPPPPPDPPDPPELGEAPPEKVESDTVMFTFSSADPEVTFECALDDDPFEPCTSPKNYSGLPNGLHRFAVRAVGPGGAGEPVLSEWLVAVPSPGPCSNPVEGTSDIDAITGREFGEYFNLLGGNDSVMAGAGDDCIDGGTGRDVMYGEDGADRIRGEDGDDQLIGGPGPDVGFGGAGHDRALGGADADRLFGGAGADSLNGGAGADLLAGGRGRDRLSGGPGDDFLRSRDGLRERIVCGAGRDRAIVDRRDRVFGCEVVRRGRAQ